MIKLFVRPDMPPFNADYYIQDQADRWWHGAITAELRGTMMSIHFHRIESRPTWNLIEVSGGVLYEAIQPHIWRFVSPMEDNTEGIKLPTGISLWKQLFRKFGEGE